MHPLGKAFPSTSLCSFIMESVGDGVFTVDRDWNVIFFNKSAGEITGIPPEQAVGRKCWEVFKTQDCPGSCALRSCIEAGSKVANCVLYIERADGAKIPVSISAAPLKDSRGEVIGGVESFRLLNGPERPATPASAENFEDFCTCDRRMTALVGVLPRIAESDSTVLLLGESGTGKELFARTIHRLSARRSGPFVAVNCGALPEHLMESELFGYKAGAFTDARKDKPGRFQLANGGTLLLDEVGDLPQKLQSKILRVLQERVFEPLGGVESVPANVRIVAATNRDLLDMSNKGEFRQDLYYRLNVVQMKLPPLRERNGDIMKLINHFLARRRVITGKDIQGLDTTAAKTLLNHNYPGNIRELQNIIEYASILCPGGLIGLEHLPEQVKPQEPPRQGCGPMTMEEIRMRAALDAVARHHGNRNAACRELDVTKDTLRRLLRKAGADEGKESDE
jgi:PAS domain S-box-containing protein